MHRSPVVSYEVVYEIALGQFCKNPVYYFTLKKLHLYFKLGKNTITARIL